MSALPPKPPDVLANARKKLESKSLDAIVLNDVSQPGIGFDSERNAVTILTHAGAETVPETSKWEVAHRVLDAVVKLKAETQCAALSAKALAFGRIQNVTQ